MRKRKEGRRKNKKIKEIRNKGTQRKVGKKGKKAGKSSCFYFFEISLLEDLLIFTPDNQMKSALPFLILQMNHLDNDDHYYYYYHCFYYSISSLLINSLPWAAGHCVIKLLMTRKCNYCGNVDCLGKDNLADNTMYLSFLIQLILLWGNCAFSSQCHIQFLWKLQTSVIG